VIDPQQSFQFKREPVPAIVVIGASAGGVEALLALVPDLPRDLPAAVFIVMHIGNRQSVLPEILERVGNLPAKFGVHGEQFKAGEIYIGPPDQHMMLYDGSILLTRGPRENHSRPAIDPLFRTAAHAYSDRVIGVVLSGAMSDGAAGLMSIKTHGGIAMVQDPNEAAIRGMPESALRLINADYVTSVREMAAIISEIVGSFGRRRSVQMVASGTQIRRENRSFRKISMGKRGTNGPKC
jgi:two-component system, chemotaxis family, protein-glutamate methylesterase/glutaminase